MSKELIKWCLWACSRWPFHYFRSSHYVIEYVLLQSIGVIIAAYGKWRQYGQAGAMSFVPL